MPDKTSNKEILAINSQNIKKSIDEQSEEFESITQKNESLAILDKRLSQYISNKNYKKSNLLSYCFRDFAIYNSYECKFDPKKLKKYNRGDVIKVNLGFKVGNEEGGLHYCVVLDKNNDISSGTLTVIPLTSIKDGKTYNRYTTINLGSEIYLNLKNSRDTKYSLCNKEISLILSSSEKN